MRKDDFVKILIIRNDHIGDMVLSTAVFRELKKAFPHSEITVLASMANSPIIKKNPYVDQILLGHLAKINPRSILEYVKTFRKIRKMEFDIGIDLRGSIMNCLFLLWLPKIKKRISRIDHHPIINLFLTTPVKIPQKNHITEDNLKLINDGLGINSQNKTLEIIIDKEDEEKVNDFLKKNKIKEYICLCPIAGLIEKQWPIKKWGELVNSLKEYNQKIILLGTKKEKKILEYLAGENKNCKVVLDFNIRKLSILFRKSNLVIAQDGGPMHIAWVSGAKLIGLYNLFLEHMNKFIPLNNSKVLYTRTKEMNTIPLADVDKEIKKLLKKS